MDCNKYLPVPIEDVLPMEIWFPIPNYEGKYEFSCLGRVRNYKTGMILKQQIDKHGYFHVGLCKYGKQKDFLINRIVCKFFYGLPDGYHADHRNWVTDDNRFINIQPLSASENSARKSNKGKKRIGEELAKYNKRKKSKSVIQFDLNGNFIAEFPSTREAERQTGINHTSISFCCRGIIKKAYGFIWRYKYV